MRGFIKTNSHELRTQRSHALSLEINSIIHECEVQNRFRIPLSAGVPLLRYNDQQREPQTKGAEGES